MKKKGIIIGVIIILVAIVGILSYNSHRNKVQFIGTSRAPIYKLVKIQYFDEGTYADYKALFTDSKGILTQSQFEGYRKLKTAKQMFKYDSESINGVMKHMKSVMEGKNANLYKIYYLKDINSQKEIKTSSYWMVEKKDGKWLIKND